MRAQLEMLAIVAQIAVRNLLASRAKTLIVSGIIGGGALLVLVGTSLSDGVDRAVRRSITGSYVGHLQVYSKRSKDDLEVMGRLTAGIQDLEPLPDFAQVRELLRGIENVKAVVPMGASNALVPSGNTVDQALERLRATTAKRLAGDRSAELERAYAAQKAHVRQMVDAYARDFAHARRMNDERRSQEDQEIVSRASSPLFWSSFEADPYEHLEFLENKLAPLASDADVLVLNYMGTDPEAFAQAFDRMRIVDGGPIPEGERGFLFSKYMYEEQVKLKAARGLDKLKEAREHRDGSIDRDPELQRLVRENGLVLQELLLQLDHEKTELFRAKLRRFLGATEGDVAKLLGRFFATTDENFDARYRFFYEQLAPHLQLYRVRVGDRLSIMAVTRSGYVRSASLKVYGTFVFQGLEDSPLTGLLNMMDMVSFRDLYGFMTPDREREIAALRAAAGARDLTRESAEAELFGSAPSVATHEAQADADRGAGELGSRRPALLAERGLASPLRPDPVSGVHAPSASASAPGPAAATRATARADAARDGRYDAEQLKSGVTLNAAVLVHDDSKIAQTIAAIEEAGRRSGLPLKAVSWQQAAGVIGQLATLLRALLFAAVLIIFAVALVVINNALVMATLERVGEIGTLRAIGAQRGFVLLVLLFEALLVAIAAGGLGILIGVPLLLVLGQTGIPAGSEVMTFLFSGPRLYPQLGGPQLAVALPAVLLLSVASSIYPAWLALKVSPREAMQGQE